MTTETLRQACAHGDAEIELLANRMRRDVVEMLEAAGSGHPGGSLSAADIVATLYFSGVMGYDVSDSNNPERDRFVLSKGHAAPILYAALAQIGYLTHDELLTLRHMGSRLQGHPDRHACPGVEVCTGSLGQGLSIGCGIALGFRADAARDGSMPKRVFVLTGDGELQEGENWESFMFAAHQHIDNLVAIIDSNNLQIDGHVSDINAVQPLAQKLAAFGWETFEIDGHDIPAIHQALESAVAVEGKPAAIIASTVKGKGVSFMEDQVSWHGVAPTHEEAVQAIAEIDAAYEQLLANQEA